MAKKQKESVAVLEAPETEGLFQSIVHDHAKNGFAWAKHDEALNHLASQGKVELHPDGPNQDGFIQTRVTAPYLGEVEKVKESVSISNESPEAQTVEEVKVKKERKKTEIDPNLPATSDAAQLDSIPFHTPQQRGSRGSGAPKPLTMEEKLADPRWPLMTMEVGQSFVVAKSQEYPNPGRSFGHLIAFASKKVEGSKSWKIKAVVAGHKHPGGFVEPTTGARVFRIS